MSLGVNANSVSMRHEEGSERSQPAAALVKHRHRARLGGDIQPLQAGVKCEYIRIFRDMKSRENLHGVKVDQGERVILFSRNECEAIGCIQCDAMRIFDSRQWIPSQNLGGRGIDGREFVYAVNRHKDMPRS